MWRRERETNVLEACKTSLTTQFSLVFEHVEIKLKNLFERPGFNHGLVYEYKVYTIVWKDYFYFN